MRSIPLLIIGLSQLAQHESKSFRLTGQLGLFIKAATLVHFPTFCLPPASGAVIAEREQDTRSTLVARAKASENQDDGMVARHGQKHTKTIFTFWHDLDTRYESRRSWGYSTESCATSEVAASRLPSVELGFAASDTPMRLAKSLRRVVFMHSAKNSAKIDIMAVSLPGHWRKGLWLNIGSRSHFTSHLATLMVFPASVLMSVIPLFVAPSWLAEMGHPNLLLHWIEKTLGSHFRLQTSCPLVVCASKAMERFPKLQPETSRITCWWL